MVRSLEPRLRQKYVMYRQLFGFRKNPFRQSPDPAYLFLGQHHEEAMAHLTYAVMKGEGFSVITGTPGVGKTTICRSFLEQLDDDVQAAYIQDAGGLSPLKLLNRINAALQIPANFDNIKDLTDTLNDFLIQKTRARQKVALFIDDAHILSNDVLEQVRLLSNLETTRHKLLQIILIGRPELSDRLSSRELRQIGQRVSVNWHINPLSYEETLAYVQHRISVSSTGPPVRFDQSAVRPLYRFTNGIPRRINSACDRILKEAYDRRERIIDEKIAKSALQKLTDRRENRQAGSNRWLIWLGIAGCLALIAVLSGAYIIKHGQAKSPSTTVVAKSIEPLPDISPDSAPPQKAEFARLLGTLAGMTKEPTDAVPDETPAALDVSVADVPEATDIAVDETPAALDVPVADVPEAAGIAVDDTPTLQLTHSVQVGAFLEKANARKRSQDLKARGYLPRVVTVTGPDGLTWYTVRIGDYPSLEIARHESDKFTALENKPSAVRPYDAF